MALVTLEGEIQNAIGGTVASTTWSIHDDGTDNLTTMQTARLWGITNLATPATDRFILTFPAGTFGVNTGQFYMSSTSTTSCVHNMTVRGAGEGVTILSNVTAGFNPWYFGGRGHPAVDTHGSKIATVGRGSTTVTVLDTDDMSLFPVGTWVVIAGLDMQTLWFGDYGYPMNPAFHDYAKITAADEETGEVTLDRQLKYAYKSTWPELSIYAPGPATMIQMPAAWDLDMVVEDLSVDHSNFNGETKCEGRSITFRRVTILRDPGVSAYLGMSQQMSLTLEDVTHPGPVEVDKVSDYILMDGCTMGNISVQSSSIDLMEFDNTTSTRLLGTPKRVIVTDSTIPLFRIGASAYGATDEITITNSEVGTDTTYNDAIVSVYDRGAGSVGVNNCHTVSGGTIVIPNGREITNCVDNGSGNMRLTVASTAGLISGKSMQIQGLDFTTVGQYPVSGSGATVEIDVINATTVDVDYAMPEGETYLTATLGTIHPFNPHNWAIPGKNLHLRGSQTNAYAFYVSNVTQDADNIYVQTSMTGDDWPAIATTGTIGIVVHPCPKYTATGVTGNQLLIEQHEAAPAEPLFSHYNRTFDNSATTFSFPKQWGRFVEMRVNVLVPQGSALTFYPFTSFTTYKADLTTYTWSPQVNANISGERVIELVDGVPTLTSGTLSGDSGLAPPEAVWLTGGPSFAPRYSTSPGAGPVQIEVTIVTDQEAYVYRSSSVAPLWLRVRGS